VFSIGRIPQLLSVYELDFWIMNPRVLEYIRSRLSKSYSIHLRKDRERGLLLKFLPHRHRFLLSMHLSTLIQSARTLSPYHTTRRDRVSPPDEPWLCGL
jgi:hypothetical protein